MGLPHIGFSELFSHAFYPRLRLSPGHFILKERWIMDQQDLEHLPLFSSRRASAGRSSRPRHR